MLIVQVVLILAYICMRRCRCTSLRAKFCPKCCTASYHGCVQKQLHLVTNLLNCNVHPGEVSKYVGYLYIIPKKWIV